MSKPDKNNAVNHCNIWLFSVFTLSRQVNMITDIAESVGITRVLEVLGKDLLILGE